MDGNLGYLPAWFVMFVLLWIPVVMFVGLLLGAILTYAKKNNVDPVVATKPFADSFTGVFFKDEKDYDVDRVNRNANGWYD